MDLFKYIIKLTPNNAHIRRVDRPESELFLVALDRLKMYPDEVSDTFWPPDHPTMNRTTSQKKRQLRAVNLRKGECNIGEHYNFIYCINCICIL